LIVTGYGLMVAIPSVLSFNWLSARLTMYEQGLGRARAELVDRLEGGHGSDACDEELDDDLSEQAVPSGA
jgi:biopolymer transport protein ExbB/TolQ